MTELNDVDKMITKIQEIFNIFNDHINENLSSPEVLHHLEKVHEKIDEMRNINYSVAKEEEALQLLMVKFKPDLLKIIQEENDFSRNEKSITEDLNKAANAANELVSAVKLSHNNNEKPSLLYTVDRKEKIINGLQSIGRLLQQEAEITNARTKLAEELRKIIVELKKS
jgi:hypothetical protein